MAQRKPDASDEHAAIRAKQIAYLDEVTERTGWSLSRIAREAGASDVTLTRFRNKAGYNGHLGLRVLRDIGRVTRIPPPADLVAGFDIESALKEPDGAPYVANDNDPMARAVTAALHGRNAVDPWVIRSRALELDGLRPGDIVLVNLNGTPAPGDVVVAQVYAFPDFRAETVFRRFDGRYLTVATLDPVIDRKVLEPGETVVIKGVVEGLVRSFTRFT